MPWPTFDGRLLIATSNPGKVAELSALLAGLNCFVIGLSDLPQPPPPVEETGTTFAQNALLKAEYYNARTGLISLADDSGLEVDALGGRPGVYSARYGGAELDSSGQIAKLLDELKDVPETKRTGRFVCCLAIAGPKWNWSFQASCEGLIAFAPRGNGGFGYDPIFIDPALSLTFAELTPAKKAALSHRGKALKEARQYIEELIRQQSATETSKSDEAS